MKKIQMWLVFFLVMGGLVTVQSINAHYSECFNHEGMIDLRRCDALPWDIPEVELRDGYIGENGTYVPGLPRYELHTVTYGNYLIGNATYTRRGFYNHQVLQEKAEDWDLDPNLYLGAIAIDSCGYIQQTAWLRVDEGEWIGPFLVADCAALIHKFERACSSHAYAEIDYETYELFRPGGRGRLDNLEIYIQAFAPLTEVGSEPVNYPETWLDDSGLACIPNS